MLSLMPTAELFVTVKQITSRLNINERFSNYMKEYFSPVTAQLVQLLTSVTMTKYGERSGWSWWLARLRNSVMLKLIRGYIVLRT